MVSQHRRRILFATLYLSHLLLAGCALPPKTVSLEGASSYWRGRLAIRVDADEGNGFPARSISAGFELTGNANEGGLTLYTPIGGTAAVLAWSQHDASLVTSSDVRHFSSLATLIEQAVGTDVPVKALFAWLAGTAASANDWTADLTEQPNGRITAKRTASHPSAELRIILDR